jgi:flagellar hook-length control protein FliK
MLQRGQATHGVLARPADAAPSSAAAGVHDNAETTTDATPSAASETAKPGTPAKAAGKLASRGREKLQPAQTPKTPSPISPSGASETPGEPDKTDPAAAAPPSAHLREWLATLNLPSHTAASAAGDSGSVAPGFLDSKTAANASAADIAKNPLGALPAVPGPDDAPGSAVAVQDAAPAATKTAELVELVSSDHRPARAAEALAARDSSPAPLSGSAGAVPRGFDAATLAPITLSAPVYSPDFAQALGAQVSLLARDGVQQAELHLNPADMGPIHVQIELQGDQARVDFSANAAATRDVIERGLPELASALREQGLTLSGGGVFQNSPQRQESGTQEPGDRARRSSSRAVAGGVAPIRTIATQVPQGRLDLYA